MVGILHRNQINCRYSQNLIYFRRKHRRIAMQLLTPLALKSFESVIDYEADILVASLYKDTCAGAVSINPANYAGRYALK